MKFFLHILFIFFHVLSQCSIVLGASAEKHIGIKKERTVGNDLDMIEASIVSKYGGSGGGRGGGGGHAGGGGRSGGRGAGKGAGGGRKRGGGGTLPFIGGGAVVGAGASRYHGDSRHHGGRRSAANLNAQIGLKLYLFSLAFGLILFCF